MSALSMARRVLGCDVGIVHLGLAVVEAHKMDCGGYQYRATHLECVDVTQYTHHHLDEATCSMPHTKEISDRVMHAVAEREELFASCNAVVIERQPVQGLQAVQALLFHHLRDRAELVHPMRLHSHHREHHGLDKDADYDQRKLHFEGWAAGWVEEWDARTKHMPRKHDVADALALADLHLYEARAEELRVEEERARRERVKTAARDGFARYRYCGE